MEDKTWLFLYNWRQKSMLKYDHIPSASRVSRQEEKLMQVKRCRHWGAVLSWSWNGPFEKEKKTIRSICSPSPQCLPPPVILFVSSRRPAVCVDTRANSRDKHNPATLNINKYLNTYLKNKYSLPHFDARLPHTHARTHTLTYIQPRDILHACRPPALRCGSWCGVLQHEWMKALVSAAALRWRMRRRRRMETRRGELLWPLIRRRRRKAKNVPLCPSERRRWWNSRSSTQTEAPS